MKKFFTVYLLLFFSCIALVPKEIKLEEEVKGFNLQKGIDKIKEKNYEEALSFFLKARNTGEDPHLSQFYITYTYYLLEDSENTIREGNRFLRNFPDSELKDEIFYFMGISYEKEKFYVRAVESFLHAFKTSNRKEIIMNSKKKIESIIKKLNFDEISSLEKEIEGTPLYPVFVYEAFLKAHKEGKIEERNLYYYKLKQIGGKYEMEAGKFFEEEKKKKKEYIAKIFLLVPLSGEFSDYGRDFVNGFNIAGLNPGIFEILDTRSDPLYTYKEVKKILEKPPYLIIGPLSTRCALSVFPVFSEEEVNVISPTASDIRLGIFGENIFAFNEGIYYEIKKLVNFAVNKGYKKIGILYPRTYEGESSKDIFIQIFNELSRGELFSISYSPDSTDYQSQIMKIKGYFYNEKDSLPDAILFLPSGERDAIEMITQLKFLKVTCPVLTIHFFLREKVISVAGEYLKNVYIAGAYVFPISSLRMDEFKEKYLKTFGKLPSDVAKRGYETGLLVKEVISYGFKGFQNIKEYLEMKGFLKGLDDFHVWREDLIKIFIYENKSFMEVEG